MENLWEMIAKARGLELNEEFFMSNGVNRCKCRVTEKRLEVLGISGEWTASCLTDELIRGEFIIEKLPFRPQKGDSYFTIVNGNEVVISLWENRSIDYTRLIARVVFRTREGAEDYVPTWLDRISKL